LLEEALARSRAANVPHTVAISLRNLGLICPLAGPVRARRSTVQRRGGPGVATRLVPWLLPRAIALVSGQGSLSAVQLPARQGAVRASLRGDPPGGCDGPGLSRMPGLAGCVGGLAGESCPRGPAVRRRRPPLAKEWRASIPARPGCI
jgi:hypothetical protein